MSTKAENLCANLNARFGRSSGDAFWPAGGDMLAARLSDLGWHYAWAEADYYFAMIAPDGSAVTYIEGDVYDRDLGPN